MLESKDDLLFERMTPMSFGTAGLRAEMGAGYSRMNPLTVLQATQGLFSYLEQTAAKLENGIVLGHDHRHHSLEFAQCVAAVFVSKNVKVHFLGLVHTPLVPFTVTYKKAACGIMITASHNPKQDNGYKLYWNNGCQIISPHDRNISACIEQHRRPWPNLNVLQALKQVDESLDSVDAYYQALAALSLYKHVNGMSSVSLCYTAMHGVGYSAMKRALASFGLPDVVPVSQQIDPHPDFPTVAYPNPEEGKGALKLAMETADAHGCPIIFANDPDADRLAVAEKTDNTWHIFTGNELGAILGCIAFEYYQQKNKDVSKVAMVSSTVSSRILSSMAQMHGFHFEETLTGFKWMGNRAVELQAKGYKVIFAFEEAIGFMFDTIVYDKDGISSLAVLAEYSNQLYKNGKTLMSFLDEIYQRYGYFESNNGYYICHDIDKRNAIFDRIRYFEHKDALNYPKSIESFNIAHVRDLTAGFDTEQTDHKPILPVSKSSQMITFKLANGIVFTLRTSGTEPKIKYYSEWKGESKQELKSGLDVAVSALLHHLLEPEKNQLIPPNKT